ncbi:SWIM zinc finger family protein [Salinadaptatus halalkaliphilus]|uniref:SWIM zinc finger family protein n=1 Tax=Salinadaptatus halalkaliphilus TaxID=2419781 RepID=A0A4V3VLI5_9EURY|nr:SWIM zinc finger family protein [Salinadaptatus halalkaliphilus]THE65787.1 SWIM zinc finger family protein [Salinadaptatus halalkaliphilus]
MNTTASPKAPLPVPPTDHVSERSRRARTEPMSVLALGDGLYEVESASDQTYLVDLESGRCSCPDHVFRDVRCKHVRRVAMEITEGRTPPPGTVAVSCYDCGESVFVDESAVTNRRRDGSDDVQATEPIYCDLHSIRPGDTVRDRETDARLTVVDVSNLRSDAVWIRDADCTVAEYGTNERYESATPVVGAVYPHATIKANGTVPRSLKVYTFPRTRLEREVPTPTEESDRSNE